MDRELDRERAEAEVMTGAAWRRYCERLATLGEEVLSDDFPGDLRSRVDGLRHLASQTACWLTYAVGQSDPATPTLFRHNDLVYRWGGPNVDQNARRAVIDGRGTYRLSGIMHSCDDFIVQVKAGEMHTGDARVGAEVRARELGIGPGDTFEITLSATEQPGNWVPMPEDANLVHVRDYYFEWQPAEPAMFVLERLDTQGQPGAAPTAQRVADLLDEAATQTETSLTYWNQYQEDRRAEQPLNTFGTPSFVPEGVHDLLYSHGFLRLAPDEALVVRLDASGSRYWDIQLYLRAWYEPLDFANRTTSLNHRTARFATADAIHLVVAGTDPGVPNWLDTDGYDEVMASFRFFGVEEPPEVETEVVRLDEVLAALPPGTPTVDRPGRDAERAARQRHVAWRYRT